MKPTTTTSSTSTNRKILGKTNSFNSSPSSSPSSSSSFTSNHDKEDNADIVMKEIVLTSSQTRTSSQSKGKRKEREQLVNTPMVKKRHEMNDPDDLGSFRPPTSYSAQSRMNQLPRYPRTSISTPPPTNSIHSPSSNNDLTPKPKKLKTTTSSTTKATSSSPTSLPSPAPRKPRHTTALNHQEPSPYSQNKAYRRHTQAIPGERPGMVIRSSKDAQVTAVHNRLTYDKDAPQRDRERAELREKRAVEEEEKKNKLLKEEEKNRKRMQKEVEDKELREKKAVEEEEKKKKLLKEEEKNRKRMMKEKVEDSLENRYKRMDWETVDPRMKGSFLFRIEFLKFGDLEYNQAYKKPFDKSSRTTAGGGGKRERLSWENQVDITILAMRLSEEGFITPLWGKFLSGEFQEVEDEVDSQVLEKGCRGVRKIEVKGVEMYLMGKEFPLRSVMILGIIVGAQYKSYENGLHRLTYSVDDGTAVIDCKCEASEFISATIKVGMLVRVTGELFQDFFSPQYGILVNKIAELKDANLESKHQLLVDKLCKEVYSQTLDLQSKLNAMRMEEKAWAGSQAPSSEAGTPKKKTKPALKAKRLDPQDLQPNFLPYIKRFLRTTHLKTIDPNLPSSSPSPSPSPSKFYPSIITPQVPIFQVPIEFTLSDLESNSDLNDFAILLAQKLEKDRLTRLGKKVLPVNKPASWTPPIKEGDIFQSKPPGWVGGGAKVLSGSMNRKGKGRDTSRGGGDESNRSIEEIEKEDRPLKGERLNKATHKLFREALIELRSSGHVVLADLEELNSLEIEANQEEEEEEEDFSHFVIGPSYDPHRISKTTSNLYDEAPSFNGTTLDHFVRPHTPKNPYKIINPSDDEDDNDNEITPKAGSNRIMHSIIEHSSPVPTSDTRLTYRERQEINSRLDPFKIIEASPSPPPLKRTLPPSKTILPTNKIVTPIVVEVPSPVRKDSNDSRTDSVYAFDMESWCLVTPALLNKPLFRLVQSEAMRSKDRNKALYKRSGKGGKGGKTEREVEGIDERMLREVMLQDARWEAVAKNTMLIKEGIEDLIERNKIVKEGCFLLPVFK